MSRPEPIVITGAGLVTALGLTLRETWAAVQEGQCGIRSLTAIESPLAQNKGGGQARDLRPEQYRDRPREVAYLELAFVEALTDAGLGDECPYPADRCGVMFGTTLAGIRSGGEFFRTDNPGALQSFIAGSTLRDVAAAFGAGGFTATTSAACASGLASLGLAMTLLRSGEMDVVIAGGYDPISEYAYAGFNSLRLVADGPSRPFSAAREGMKLAEGYAVVVLERVGDARRRGAEITATLVGYGEASDSHHLTKPHPEGDGASRAMRAALESARIEPLQIGLIVAHATGTPDNDATEHAALQHIFGEGLSRVPLVAFKSHLGHTLGGAGTVELILAAEALRSQQVPPTPTVTAAELEFADLALVPGHEPRPATIGHTLSISQGFGGANSCMILGPGPAEPSPASTLPTRRRVLITGVGVIAPKLIGNDAFAQRLAEPPDHPLTADTGTVEHDEIGALLQARRVRRMSSFVKLMLAAARLALEDAGIGDTEAFAASCGALLGSMHGSTSYSEEYYRNIVEQGIEAANPMLFAEGVPNVASAQLSLMLGLRGGAQTIVGSRTAGMDALQLAALRIGLGEWDRAIVGASEEYSTVVNRAYRHCGRYARHGGGTPFFNERGFQAGAGAAVIVLESPDSAAARAAEVRGTVEATGATHLRGNGVTEPDDLAIDVLASIGDPAHVIASANATDLDRIERAALARSAARAHAPDRPLRVSTLYGYLAETFSVGPLASVAAGLLTRRLPALPRVPGDWSGSMRPADGTEKISRFGVLCCDHTGPLRAVRIGVAD